MKNVRISAEELVFVDSVAENQKVAHWGFGTIFVFLLYLVLWGLVIGSTSMNWIQEKKETLKQKQIEESTG